MDNAAENFAGIGVGRGIAIGPVRRMPEPLAEPDDVASTREPADERERVSGALAAVAAELAALGERAGGDARDVLEAQSLMANDPAIVEDIEERIASRKTAERAAFEAFRSYRFVLEALGGYLAARGADLADVSQRVIARLTGVALPGIPTSDIPFVLVADDLSPADTAVLDLTQIVAFVTRSGGPTSHTAILARSRGIVALVGASGVEHLHNDTLVIVDAAAGTVSANPSPAHIEAARARLRVSESLPATPGRLADGTHVPLLANVGSLDEARAAADLGAEGIGLLRTEFLFLGSTAAPSLETQRDYYASIFAAFPGQKITVRVLDAGADKPLSYLDHGHEDNPALGRRGIRILRDAEQVLRTQLRALAEAAELANADLWTMAPMVADVEETEYFVNLAREYGLGTVGITAEVPSAALVAGPIAERTDFVSIGTNDLTQYALAADRQLGTVARYQDPWHPAVLRLVEMIADAGAAAGKPVAVCGEAAADPLLAVVLVGLGVTELSMAAPAFADVRAELSRHTLAGARALAVRARQATSASGARAAVSAALA